MKVQLKAKANEKAIFFSIIHPDEISKILKEEHHLDIPSKFIEIEKPIKELGEHTLKAKHQEFVLDVLAGYFWGGGGKKKNKYGGWHTTPLAKEGKKEKNFSLPSLNELRT